MLRLSSLETGEKAVIRGFEGVRRDTAFPDRERIVLALMRAGFLPGSQIAVVAKGLGGDPIACDVRGARVAIGRAEAEIVDVEKVTNL